MQCTTRPFFLLYKCKECKEIKGFNRCGIPYAQCAHRHGPRMLSILTARLMHLGKLERDTPKCHVFEASTSHHTVSNCLMLRLAGTT